MRVVSHRDVKADNDLFDPRGSAKFVDFGSAGFDAYDGKMINIVGTPYYVVLEVLAGGEYCEKFDVWSVGIVLYVMLVGFFLFYIETADEIFKLGDRGESKLSLEEASYFREAVVVLRLAKEVLEMQLQWRANTIAELNRRNGFSKSLANACTN